MRSLFVLFSVVCLATLAVAPPPSTQFMTLQGVVRDFWPCDGSGQPAAGCGTKATPTVSCGSCHVDFEGAVTGDDVGVVDSVLPDNLRPVLKAGAQPTTIKDFNKWYLNQDGLNLRFPHNITLANRNPLCNTKDGDGVWDPCSPNVFSYIDGNFFPVDGRGFGNYGTTNRNFHFTYAIHGRLYYSGPSDKIGVNSEDDFWLFVNNRLAIDLGGVHDKESRKVNLGLDSLGLERKKSYPFSIFFASRHTPGSQFRLSTNVPMTCPSVDHCGVCNGDGQSCCNYCNDNNPCTADSCDRDTGRCINKLKSCPSPDMCNEGVCNPNNGQCTTKAVVCQSNDLCVTPTCIPESGCSYNPKVCNDKSLCTTDGCDPATGQCKYNPFQCNDNNPCTDDSCDASAGCKFVPKNCDDGNACTADSCVNGACVNTPITCSNNDKCKTASCDTKLGCVSSPVVCNDNDKCTTDSCSASSGCVFTPIPQCGNLCAGVVCGGTPCAPSECNPATGKCESRTVNCNDGDSCTDDSCTVLNGKAVCVNAAKTCNAPDSCHTAKCVNGACVNTAIVCDDNNLCTTDSCVNGQCNFAPKSCPAGGACSPQTCDRLTGQCVVNSVNCDDLNACTLDTCVPSGGPLPSCGHSPISCPEADICHISSCDPVTGCRMDPINCDDGNACTTDTCDVEQGGCVHTPVAVPEDGNACIDTFCDPYLGIQSNEVTCLPRECKCDPDEGCVCPNWFEALSDTEKGLGAGALAVIVIGGAAGAAFLAFGGKKGYDFWAAKNMAMANVNTNPLYVEKPSAFDNPLYEAQPENA